MKADCVKKNGFSKTVSILACLGALTLLRGCGDFCLFGGCENQSGPIANVTVDPPNPPYTTCQTITFNGSGSSDQAGNTLTYQWSITTNPTSSTATLSSPTSVETTFMPDLDGGYTIQLVVNNGTTSSSPQSVSLTPTLAPVAVPGTNQSGVIGQPVSLDGSQSRDPGNSCNPNTTGLTFAWTLTNPAGLDVTTGSPDSLDNPAAVNPTFTPQTIGSYKATLTVTSTGGGNASAPVSVYIDVSQG